MPITVSIILPAYNEAATLYSAISSAQAQSFADFELIVIDDASDDGTAAIVEQFSRGDPRIRCIRNATNLGPAGARNAGIAQAQGKWIALLDADDTFEPSRLARMLSTAETCRADIVSDNLRLHNPDGNVRFLMSEDRFAPPRLMSFKEFIDGCFYNEKTPKRSSFVFMHPMFSAAFLRERGLRYDAQSRNGEDFLLYLDCFAAGGKWAVSSEAHYNYTVRPGSLTEVVTDDDRARMIRKLDQMLKLPFVSTDRSLAASIKRHRQLIAQPHVYKLVKDRVKSGRFAEAIGLLSTSRNDLRLFLREVRHRKLHMWAARTPATSGVARLSSERSI